MQVIRMDSQAGLSAGTIPSLACRASFADAHYNVAGGKMLSIPLPTDTLGIVASERGDPSGADVAATQQATPIPLPTDRSLKWTAPSGSSWQVTLYSPGGNGFYTAVAGQTLSITVPPDTQRIEANAAAGGRRRGGHGGNPGTSTILPVPTDGQFKWAAPGDGSWEVTFVRHVHRSSPTRFTNREDGTNDKDSLYSLIDFLNPQATATYLKVTHEKYEKLVGDEFGKTILGFRADETDFTGFLPWTPKLLETFKQQKGYDLQPYIAGFFVNPLTVDETACQGRLLGCLERHVSRQLLQAAAGMVPCAKHELHGSPESRRDHAFTRGRRRDDHQRGLLLAGHALYGRSRRGQSQPDRTRNRRRFPPSSRPQRHICFGRPLVWDEEGGGTGQNGKFVVDYQLVRGINYMNIRGLNGRAACG